MFSSVYIALRVKPSFFCIVACFSSVIYTSYVQVWNKPLGKPYAVTRGVIQNTPLVNGDRLSFQFEDQNKNIVQLSYRIKSALEKKKNATIIRRDIMCIRG